MYPKTLKYVKAKSVRDAILALSQDENARFIAGGQSIMPMLKLRLMEPSILVDISELPELRNVKVDGDYLIIGSMVKHHEVIDNQAIRENLPMLSTTAEHIADVQIRNRGTIGGSICEADPSADYLPTLIALDAEITLESSDSSRTVSVEEFIAGPYETTIEPGEILTSVKIKKNTLPFVVEKYATRAADFAVSSIVAIVDVKVRGKVSDIRIVVGAQDGKPERLKNLENSLKGTSLTREVILKKVEAISDELDPINDIHGGSEYRRQVTLNLLVNRLDRIINGVDSK
jgi:CO/xanthine dehydrogenase FAD-binding subunit